MNETSDLILSYLEGRSPDEIRGILAGLERAARFDAQEKAEASKDQAASLAAMPLDELQEVAAAVRVKHGVHSEQYRAAYSALRDRLAQEERAAHTPPSKPVEEPKPQPKRPDPGLHWWQMNAKNRVTAQMYADGHYQEEPPSPPAMTTSHNGDENSSGE
jgi:hypothetical protein